MALVGIQPVATRHPGQDVSRLALLYQVTEQVNSTLQLDQCLDRIIDGAYRIFQAEKVSLMLIDEAHNEMHIAAARNIPTDVVAKARVPVGSGLAGKVALTGEALVVANVEDDPRIRRKSKERYETGSFAIVPLRIKDRVLGVLNLTNRADGAPFSQDDLALLTALANQAAIAIENSRLITQLNLEKEQLKRSAFKMQSLVASMAEGVLMFDATGELVVLNPKARSMLGLAPAGEFTAESLFKSVLHKDLGSFLAQPVTDDGTLREFSTDGQPEPRTLSIALTPVTNDRNQRLGRLAVIRDVTLQRELDRMKSDFVAVVSHELRTPLASIKACIGNLHDGIDGNVNDAQRDTLQRVTKNVDRLTRLINDLLDLSKLEAGKMKMHLAPMDTRAIIESVAGIFAPAADAKHIRLNLQFAPTLPVLWADPDRIEQVLTNLLGNALKFTPEHGAITLSVQRRLPEPTEQFTAPPERSPLSGEGFLSIAVTDTGIGIPETDLERVFDKFYQVDRSMTRQTGGTGLGLPICREIIARHGGRIWAESTLNHGATFTFEIPVDSRRHDRAQLQLAMEREIRRAKRYRTPFSVLMLDIDDFTAVNTAHGYPNGDTALLQLHEILRLEVKKYLQKRIRETDIVGRFGGDEFLAVAPETDEPGARLFAERLRKLIEDHPFVIGDVTLQTTISVGLTAFREEDLAPVTLVRRAASALVHAKSSGKNAVRSSNVPPSIPSIPSNSSTEARNA